MEALSFHPLKMVGHKSIQGAKYLSRGEHLHLRSRRKTRICMDTKSRKALYCMLTNSSEKTAVIAPMDLKTQYKDNWIETMAINYLCKCVQEATGMTTDLDGYDGLVEVVSRTVLSFSPTVQRELIVHALHRAVPKIFINFARIILRPSKITSEYFAASTPFLFGWLVGPCEVRHTEIDGCQQKSMVHIKKCRLLETTNCAGICTNLCKIPSQRFIGESLGTAATLTPNFEDMSCEMVFGKKPPPIEEDPAFTQPCYKLCNLKQKHREKCP